MATSVAARLLTAWLTPEAHKDHWRPSIVAGAPSVTTEALTEQIIARATAIAPDVRVLRNIGAHFSSKTRLTSTGREREYRHDERARVPLALVTARFAAAVWAYGDDVHQTRRLPDFVYRWLYGAFDVVVTIGTAHAAQHVEPSGRLCLDVYAQVDDAGTLRFSARDLNHRGFFGPLHGWRAIADATSPERAVATRDAHARALSVLHVAERVHVPPASPRICIHATKAFVRGCLFARASDVAPAPLDGRLIRRIIRDAATSSLRGGLLIEELPIQAAPHVAQSAIADLALFGPSTLHVFEVKGETDSLTRLTTQATTYNAVASHVTLVCATRHAVRAQAAMPAWWGLWLVDRADDGSPRITRVRESGVNPSRDTAALLGMLHVAELKPLASQCGVRGRAKYDLVIGLAQRANADTAAAHVIAAYLARFPNERTTAWERFGTWEEPRLPSFGDAMPLTALPLFRDAGHHEPAGDDDALQMVVS